MADDFSHTDLEMSLLPVLKTKKWQSSDRDVITIGKFTYIFATDK